MAVPAILAASTPIIAAFVTSVAALLGLIITKENKISELRQDWINGLREDITTLQANALLARHIFGAHGPNTFKQEGWQQAILNADTALASVRLRLNVTEESARTLMAVLDDIQAFTEQDVYPAEELRELENRLHAATRGILKPEWDRVRKGEPIYRKARSIAVALAILLVASIIAIAVVAVRQAVLT